MVLLNTITEEDYINKYSKLLWLIVNETARKSERARNAKEDLHQEGVIALLNYGRSCRTEDELNRFPFYPVKYAMLDYIVALDPFSRPHNRNNYKPRRSVSFQTVSADALQEDGIFPVDDLAEDHDDIVVKMCFEDFFNDLSDEERSIVSRRLHGMSQKEISDQLGICPPRVTRRLQRARQQWSSAFSENWDTLQ